ncbi:MAG: PH domain-containing protein [Planctomycetia bacterium]|nr:PH domain-containing protein [Planctomycetia bacterium]
MVTDPEKIIDEATQDVQNEKKEAKPLDYKWHGGNYSGKSFRLWFLFLLFVTILFAIPPYYLGRNKCWVWGIFLFIPFVAWVYSWVVYLYRTLTIQYVLEKDRLISKKGLFWKTTDTTFIPQINDIKLKQTLWDQWLNGNVGTIVLYTSDTTDSIQELKCLENPQEVYESIDALRNEFIRRRGIKNLGGGFIGDDEGTILSDQ